MTKTLLRIIEQKSNNTSNLGLKFWLWALETIIHWFYPQGFWSKQKSYISRGLMYRRFFPSILEEEKIFRERNRMRKINVKTLSNSPCLCYLRSTFILSNLFIGPNLWTITRSQCTKIASFESNINNISKKNKLLKIYDNFIKQRKLHFIASFMIIHVTF
jgi:hypothetical protein